MTPIGGLLREWRERRRFSQMGLALQAGISPRHLSFIETGRSLPSRDVIAQLAEELQVPLRDQNRLLLAAGYAPPYAQTPLESERMTQIQGALQELLVAHEPFPAIAIDREWNVVGANRGLQLLTAGLPEDLLAPPVNALRLGLHPRGLASRIVNLDEWRAHLLGRLKREIELTQNQKLVELHRELLAFTYEGHSDEAYDRDEFSLFVPLRIQVGDRVLTFLSTVTTFGTARDITIEELSVETFFPADEVTSAALVNGDRDRFRSAL
jgi:transcriptional regulator with XRE-family HTH domain